MIEHWYRTTVTGHLQDGTWATAETVLHREGEDAVRMAMQRNHQLAACMKIEARTVKAFSREKAEEPRRTQEQIPRDDRQGEEFEW